MNSYNEIINTAQNDVFFLDEEGNKVNLIDQDDADFLMSLADEVENNNDSLIKSRLRREIENFETTAEDYFEAFALAGDEGVVFDTDVTNGALKEACEDFMIADDDEDREDAYGKFMLSFVVGLHVTAQTDEFSSDLAAIG